MCSLELQHIDNPCEVCESQNPDATSAVTSELNIFSHSVNNKSYDKSRYSGLYSVDKLIGNLSVEVTGKKFFECLGMFGNY